MRYYFILGTNPALSAAEIAAVLPPGCTTDNLYPQAMFVQADEKLNTEALMNRLGGTIKIGRIAAEGVAYDEDALVAAIQPLLANDSDERITFGISIHTLDTENSRSKMAGLQTTQKHVGMTIKKTFKEEGRSCRWVTSNSELQLSSVTVEKERLTTQGKEIVIFVKNGACDIGVTEVVQAFEDFSKADFGRPSRDVYQGMLPPKLARIMVNVSKAATSERLYDPFCGSGTILTEALRLGYRQLTGSDKNRAAIQSTTNNIAWISKKFGVGEGDAQIHLFPGDAREAGRHIKDYTIGTIVAETYLGVPRTGKESRGELQKRLHELTTLYYESLSAWRRLLKPGAAVVLALPVYVTKDERHGIIASEFSKLGYTLEPLLPASMISRLNTKETKNHGLIYGRSDQFVWREIIRLRLTPTEK